MTAVHPLTGRKQSPEHIAAKTASRNCYRKEAKLAGRKTYEGKVHERCGNTLRYTVGGGCVHCATAAGMTPEQKQRNRKAGGRYRRRKGMRALPEDARREPMRKAGVNRAYTLFKYQVRRYWPHLSVEDAIQEFDKILIDQAGLCAICNTQMVGRDHADNELTIDHCHATNRLRGLLCRSCNRIVHKLLTPELCRRVENYISK